MSKVKTFSASSAIVLLSVWIIVVGSVTTAKPTVVAADPFAGAVGGAIIGSLVTGRGSGALAGAVIGGVVGGVVRHERRKRWQKKRNYVNSVSF